MLIRHDLWPTVGPSPRAWGKLLPWYPPGTHIRTIPTGVGKTQIQRVGAWGSADHPHGRGENAWAAKAETAICGPSPRAWGKQLAGNDVVDRGRTISTGVGKTLTLKASHDRCSDHPHGRGENWIRRKNKFAAVGPSPRAWGKLISDKLIKLVNRTIPTGVGKTLYLTNNVSYVPDHPHGRGENIL